MIRRAKREDINSIMNLLYQVGAVHHNGRPDLFKPSATKYSEDELEKLLLSGKNAVFVYEDENGNVVAHSFCEIIEHKGERLLEDIKTLYVDDICVDESSRGLHIGKKMWEHIVSFANSRGCRNVTLNVWECNPGAKKFYEKMGLTIQKTCMEMILDVSAKENEE